jgi:quinol monooxygenase YgiN
MVTVGLLATLHARPGKEDEVADLLKGALSLAQAEDDTIAWFATRTDETTFGIFDVFPGPRAARHISTDPSPPRSCRRRMSC